MAAVGAIGTAGADRPMARQGLQRAELPDAGVLEGANPTDAVSISDQAFAMAEANVPTDATVESAPTPLPATDKSPSSPANSVSTVADKAKKLYADVSEGARAAASKTKEWWNSGKSALHKGL